MNSEALLMFFGETIAAGDVPIGQPWTAHQLKLLDRAWREKYLDSLVHAPCAHESKRRISGKYCEDCGRNVQAGPGPEEEAYTETLGAA